MREGEKSWAVFLLRNRAEHGVLLPQASSPPETAEDNQDLPTGKIVSKAKFVPGIHNLPFFFFCLSFLVGVPLSSSPQCVFILNFFFPRTIEMALTEAVFCLDQLSLLSFLYFLLSPLLPPSPSPSSSFSPSTLLPSLLLLLLLLLSFVSHSQM